jgi:hypothetical protein
VVGAGVVVGSAWVVAGEGVGVGSAALLVVAGFVGVGATLTTAGDDETRVEVAAGTEDERCLQRWVFWRLRRGLAGMSRGAGAATRAARA